MSVVTCRVCERIIPTGTSAWADDWIVIDEEGTRTEVRYTCDPCGALNSDSEQHAAYCQDGAW